MAKEKMVFFRTAIGGFNKTDVNTYIEKLNFEFSERERVAKKKYDLLEAKLAEFEDYKVKYDEALASISSLEEAAAQRETVINEYRADIEKQAEKIETLIREKEEAESEMCELSQRIDSLSEVICKSEKYDDISAQIGEIILSARHTAEGIVAKAEKDAAAKSAAADEKLESAAAAFNARAATAAYSVKNHIKKLVHDSYSAVAQKAAETSDMLRKLAAHINDSTEYLDEKLSEKNEAVETAISNETTKLFSDEHRITFKK